MYINKVPFFGFVFCISEMVRHQWLSIIVSEYKEDISFKISGNQGL